MRGAFRFNSASDVASGGIRRAYARSRRSAGNARAIMIRGNTRRKGCPARIAARHIAHGRGGNTPHFRRTIRVFRTGESYYIRSRYIYAQRGSKERPVYRNLSSKDEQQWGESALDAPPQCQKILSDGKDDSSILNRQRKHQVNPA
jgi:hypothetical protein